MVGRLFRSIRRKPKAVRDQYALGVAIVVTSLVVLLWVWQLPERFDEGSVVGIVPTESGAFGGLLGEFKDRLSAVSDDVQEIAATSTPQQLEVIATSTVSSELISTTSLATSTPQSVGRPVRIATTSASTTQ